MYTSIVDIVASRSSTRGVVGRVFGARDAISARCKRRVELLQKDVASTRAAAADIVLDGQTVGGCITPLRAFLYRRCVHFLAPRRGKRAIARVCVVPITRVMGLVPVQFGVIARRPGKSQCERIIRESARQVTVRACHQ